MKQSSVDVYYSREQQVIIMTSWDIQNTDFGRLTVNSTRVLTERVKIEPNPNKQVITLQIGDPSIFGNFPPPKECIDAIKRAIDVDNFAYYPIAGIVEAKKAVAEYVIKNNVDFVTADDVILTSGCSMALEMCFRVLAEPGDNILIPRPCFIYKTWMAGCKIEDRLYNLDPSKDWDIDLQHMESQIDDKTKAIVINNPSNPCGSIYSKDHIKDILKVAERHRIPIIADEVYEHFVFPGVEYHSISSLSKIVPVLSCSGLTKRFLMPGIRVGWIVIHDRNNSFALIRQGLHNICGRNFGPNSTVQQALPDILRNTPHEYLTNAMEKIAQQAENAYNLLMEIPGLNPIMPKGSMYMMIGIDLKSFPTFSSCLDFTQGLIREQSVLTFPGYPCFEYPGFFRIVLTVPEDMIIESCFRIREFCGLHYTAVQMTEL